MNRQYCDACGVETTDKKSSAISGIADADWDGDGTSTDHFCVCVRCYRAWKAWMKSNVRRSK